MKTKFLYGPAGTLAQLHALCPGVSDTHCHAAWGRTQAGAFATALETVYPEQLCRKIAELIVDRMRFVPQVH